MEGNNIAGLEQGFLVGNCCCHTALIDLVGGEECVISINFHTEAFGDAGNIASNITESEDTKFLAHQLAAALSVVEIADAENEQTHNELSNGIAVLARGVHCDDATGGASLKVEVVESGASADNDLQLFGVVDDLFGDLVAADDESVGIGNGCVEVVHVGIFLEKSQSVAILLNHFADAVNGHFCERFFGSYEYFHCLIVDCLFVYLLFC